MASPSRPVSTSQREWMASVPFDLERRRDLARKVVTAINRFKSSREAEEVQNNRIMQSFIVFAIKGVRPSRTEVEEVENDLLTHAQESQDLLRKYLLFSGYAYSKDGLVELGPETRLIADILMKNDLDPHIIELPPDIDAADKAAKVLGCHVAQIVKSLVFRTEQTHRPTLVLSSVASVVDERKIAYSVNEKVILADASFAYEATGFRLGSIPAIGHRQQMTTFIDEDLLKFEEIWAGAGTTHALFCVDPKKLEQLTKGKVIQTKRLG